MRASQWLRLRARALFDRTVVEREMEEELAHHLELDVQDRVRRGVEPQAARREAALAFGAVDRWKEECRDARGVRLLDDLRQDLRYGLRSLRRSATFTAMVVAILGVAIGLASALFAAFHAVLLEPLPYAEEERLVVLWQTALREGGARDQLAAANFLDLQERARGLAGVAVAMEYTLDAMGHEGPEVVPSWRVSEGFFELLGGSALLGRTLAAGDHRSGEDRVAVLSYRHWQGRFGGDQGIVGRSLTLDGEPYEVVGVMPPGFAHPFEKAMWTPLWLSEEDRSDRFAAYFHAIGRLADGVTLAGLQAELDAVAGRLARENPRSNDGVGFVAAPLRETVVGGSRTMLWVLMAAVGLLFGVACSNVANLFLWRTTARGRELAVRAALGAGRARVRRQLLTEAALLAAAGCALGLLVAWQAVEALRALAPAELPRREQIALDPVVLAFAAAVAVAAVLLFGVVPAMRAARRRPGEALPGAGRRVTAGAGSHGPARALAVAGVGLSFVLAVGAGLLLRSFLTLQRADPGYRSEGILVASFFLYGHVDSPAQRLAFVRDVGAKVEALPGVRAVGLGTAVPLMEQIGREDAGVAREGDSAEQEITVRAAAVTPGIFEVLGIPLLAGRLLTEADDARVAPVAVISESLARRLFPGEDPLGRPLVVGFPRGPVTRQVVGVVGDVRHATLDEHPGPAVYVPLLQAPAGALNLVVAAGGDPARLAGAVSREIWTLAPAMPLYATTTMDELRGRSLQVRQFALMLLAVFAGTALLLAAFGVYGLMNAVMAERRGEIGVRLVLGARARGILAGVLGDSARMALLGLALGALLAAAATRLLGTLLYGVTALDPLTFLAGGGVILAVAVAAGLGPAWRAATTDPVATLAGD